MLPQGEKFDKQLTLCDSGESVVYYSRYDPIALDRVLHTIQTEVDVFLVCVSHQDVASMHVPVLKLKSLQKIVHYLVVVTNKVMTNCFSHSKSG